MKQLRNALVLFALLPTFVLAQSAKQEPESLYQKRIRVVSAITPKPEISREQANEIYLLYFDLHLRFKCGPDAFYDRGDHWVLYPSNNDDCIQDKTPILIHKRSGKITWAKGNSYESPQALANAALLDFKQGPKAP